MLLLDSLTVVMEAYVQDIHQRVFVNRTVICLVTVVTTSIQSAVSSCLCSILIVNFMALNTL